VDEAIQLADRILILREGRFVTDVRIEAPKPRDRSSAEFLSHRRALLTELGVDTRGSGGLQRSRTSLVDKAKAFQG